MSLEKAFDAFESEVRASLEQEARQSVEQALQRISKSSGPYRVTSFEFDIVIRDVNVSLSRGRASAGRSRTRKPATRRKASTGAARGTGRPPGPLRTALTEIFAAADGQLSTDEIRRELEDRGLKATSANLSQQLRRLSTSGAIQRVGRGSYRGAAATGS